MSITGKLIFIFSFKKSIIILLSPLYILKCFFLSKLSDTFVNLLKVLCSSTIPNLFIVKQFFIFGAKNYP